MLGRHQAADILLHHLILIGVVQIGRGPVLGLGDPHLPVIRIHPATRSLTEPRADIFTFQ